jgi:hypothetical protein
MMCMIRLDDWDIGQPKITHGDLMGSFRRAAKQAYEAILSVLMPAELHTYDLNKIAGTLLSNQPRSDVPTAIQAQNRKSNPNVTTAFISVDSDGFIKMERAFQPQYKGKGPYPGVYVETSFYTPEGEYRGGDTPVCYISGPLREWEAAQLQDRTKTPIPTEHDSIAQKYHYARTKDTHYPGTPPLSPAA